MSPYSARAIKADQVGVDLDGVTVLDGVSLDVVPGEVLCLVGPNGAGKSTLLAVLSGERRPARGTVTIGGRELSGIRHSELARLRSVLTQENSVSFPFRVVEVVAMGRAPWARTLEGRDDIQAVAAAMDAADIRHLATRRYTALSGGERARVSLARVLAQRAGTVFLDEPTASLDLRHQEDVMRIARGLAAEGRAVVVVVHDLSLASAYADRLALVAEGRLEAIGSPAEVLTEERIERVYGLPVELHLVGGRPVVVPTRATPDSASEPRSSYAVKMVDDLTSQVPALLATVKEHVDYFDGMLPHLLMGELVTIAEAPNALTAEDVSILLNRLEWWYVNGAPDVQNVLEASFLENLGPGSDLPNRLGPRLRAKYTTMFQK